MKIDDTTYAKMQATMKAVVECAGGPARVLDYYADNKLTVTRMLWDLWNVADRNLRYDDNHPAFKSGTWTRAHPQDSSFNIYADPTVKDSHILTALNKIGKELGLIT